MKTLLALLCLISLAPFCLGQNQSNTQLEECQKVVTKRADPLYSSGICSIMVSKLGPDEHVVSVDELGVLTLSNGIFHEHPYPPKLQSTLQLENMKRTIEQLEQGIKEHPGDTDAMGTAMLPGFKDLWSQFRDSYCSNHPDDAYMDLSDKQQICPDSAITGAMFVVKGGTPSTPNSKSSNRSLVASRACRKTITFAVAQNGHLAYQLPSVSSKWIIKAQKKYPNVCFSQFGAQSGQKNYLVVLSSSSSAFGGLQPIFHRSTDTAPVSGNGTVTDNVGSTWNFTYQGTVTTTTTTQTNVAYTDTNADFYANAYSEDGSLVGASERSASSRQGGDPYNALGYNLTSALLSHHLKEHLLDSIVKKVSALP